MIAGGEYGIDAHGSIEILFGPTEIPEVVLGYASEEEILIISAVQTLKDVEILYGLRKFAFCQSSPAPVHKHILVVLGIDIQVP